MGELGRTRTRRVTLHGEADPLRLASGAQLAPVEVAYETYGTPDNGRTNTVVVCHALTGEAHAAGHHGDPERPGWWDLMIGPGKPIDTERYHVVSANLLGGCKGTTGPASTDPATGRAYGLRFPLPTVGDLVELQRRLLTHLGITRPLAAIGGSLGGMQALEWSLAHPGELGVAVVLCASARLTDQNIAISKIAREAILRDPAFHGGDYAAHGATPRDGLALARMLGHVTYLSEPGMTAKFGRRRAAGGGGLGVRGPDFEVETYLDHQAEIFLERFDANTYLYLSRVMDGYDAFADTDRLARQAANPTRHRMLSFSSDWRFSSAHSAHITATLRAAGAEAEHTEIASELGHDSFLLEVPAYHRAVAGWLAEALDARG